MEKNKNISLDELFARAKGEEPVISQEDVRAIVSSVTSPMQSIKTTTSIISRKGFIMTGLGLVGATAALIGYLTFGSGQLPQGSGQWSVASGQLGSGGIKTVTPTTTPEAKKEVKETKTLKKVIIVKNSKNGEELNLETAELPVPPEPPMPPVLPLLPDGKLMAPVEVESVGIIQAKESDLPKLGLDESPGVGLGFYVKWGGDKYKKYNIPENGWGVAEINVPFEKPDVVLAPVVITDSRGNKRYMHFADENSMVHMEQYEGDALNSIVINDEEISSNDKNVLIRKGEINNDKKFFRAKKTISNSIVVNHDSSHTVSSMFVIDSVNPKNTKGVVVKVDMDNDEPMPSDYKFDIKMGDSTVKVGELVREAMAKAKIAMKDMKVGMDSMRNAMVKVKIEKNGILDKYAELDTSLKNLNKQMSSIMVIDQNFSPEEAEQLDKGVMIGMPDIDGTMKAMEVKITAKLNSLVPVLVRKPTEVTRNKEENRDYDNGVIMWFEPKQFWKQYEDVASSYEVAVKGDLIVEGPLANSVQSKQSEKSKSTSIVSNIMVYPNPVRTAKANIHYTLSEARSVAFSIHDILGKKIVDCGSLAERPQGEYDFELNIGNIPAGIYLVVITTDKGEQTIQRIAVEK